jgi:Tol biopolymer transport system component
MKSMTTLFYFMSISIPLVLLQSQPPSQEIDFDSMNMGSGYPSWSYDEKYIAFSTVINNDVWVINSDGTDLRNLTGEFNSYDELPHWSPKTNDLAFSSDRSRDRDIWIMNFETAESFNFTPEIEGVKRVFSWSPDGSYLAFVAISLEDGNPSSVWVKSIDGSTLTEIFSSNIYEIRSLTWSPDSSRIMFYGVNENTTGVWVSAIDDPNPQALKTILHDPAWSPINPALVASYTPCAEWGFNIVLFNIESQRTEQLTDDCSAIRLQPLWSPDGELLLYNTVPFGLGVININEQTHFLTTNFEGEIFFPSWSPTSERVAFAGYDGDRWDIWVMNADGSNFINLTAPVEN